jgi:hypothetical protein
LKQNSKNINSVLFKKRIAFFLKTNSHGKNFMNLKTKNIDKIPVTVIVSVKVTLVPSCGKAKTFSQVIVIDSGEYR